MKLNLKPPDVRIVRFRTEHLPRIMQIERASFSRDAYSRSLFRELQAAPGSVFLVARLGRAVAGYIVGIGSEIVSVAVDPVRRGAGVGSALMRHALAELASAGTEHVELVVRTDNLAAIRFYRLFGFRRLRLVAGYYEDGGDGWLMRKSVGRRAQVYPARRQVRPPRP